MLLSLALACLVSIRLKKSELELPALLRWCKTFMNTALDYMDDRKKQKEEKLTIRPSFCSNWPSSQQVALKQMVYLKYNFQYRDVSLYPKYISDFQRLSVIYLFSCYGK